MNSEKVVTMKKKKTKDLQAIELQGSHNQQQQNQRRLRQDEQLMQQQTQNYNGGYLMVYYIVVAPIVSCPFFSFRVISWDFCFILSRLSFSSYVAFCVMYWCGLRCSTDRVCSRGGGDSDGRYRV